MTGLKAGSQPSSVGWSIGAIGSRLALKVRLTEMVTLAVLSALTGLVNPVIAPAMKQLKREAAAICLSLLSNVQRMTLFRSFRLRSLQKETAFNTNRPTNMAVSDRPKTSAPLARSSAYPHRTPLLAYIRRSCVGVEVDLGPIWANTLR